MKAALVLALGIVLAGCCTTPNVNSVQFVPPQVNIDARLLAGCPKELPLLNSGEEADVVINYASVTAVYAECADTHAGLLEVFQRLVGEYAKAVGKYIEDVKKVVGESK